VDVVVEVGGWEHECCGDATERNQLVDLYCIRYEGPDGPVRLTEGHDGRLDVPADERVRGRVTDIQVRRTGGVLALADYDPATGATAAVGAASIRAALDRMGITTTRSGFDTALTDGLTLINQEEYAAAAEHLLETTTHVDSPVTRQYLAMARELAAAQQGPGGDPVPRDGEIPWWTWASMALLVLAALLAGLVIGRRRPRPAGPDDGPAPLPATGQALVADDRAGATSGPADGAAPAAGTPSPARGMPTGDRPPVPDHGA
jgi:hypothetical protein